MAEGLKGRLSLRFRLALALSLLSGATLLVLGMALDQGLRQQRLEQSIEQGLAIVACLTPALEAALQSQDDEALQQILRSTLRAPGIRNALVVDQQQIVRATSDNALSAAPRRNGLTADPWREEPDYQVFRHPGGDPSATELRVVLRSSKSPADLFGEVHLTLSPPPERGERTALVWRLAVLAGLALTVGAALAYKLAGSILRPLTQLTEGCRAVARGDLDQQVVPTRQDEIGALALAFNVMVAGLREKSFLQSILERYLSKPLAQEILSHKNELRLGGEEREVTILFSDIRRFTAIAEHLPAGEVVDLLNDYFSRMIQVIAQHEGTVDKLMGDSIMVLFGAPLPQTDAPLRAVRCALDMQQAATAFNLERLDKGQPPIEMGIGINSGPVIAGNIGSAMRMEYTVIGDNVNVAARLQGVAKPGEILISEATFDKVRGQVRALAVEPQQLRGRQGRVTIFRIDGLK